jgi:hypothetical protein
MVLRQDYARASMMADHLVVWKDSTKDNYLVAPLEN